MFMAQPGGQAFVGRPEKQVTHSSDLRMSDRQPESLSPKRLGILGPGPGTWTHIDDKGSLTLATAGGAKAGTPVLQLE